MPNALYITADRIGQKSGGGRVTYEEYAALAEFTGGDVHPIDRDRLGGSFDNPFQYDYNAEQLLRPYLAENKVQLAHLYAGGFPKTTKLLKQHGVRISYTCAAHDRKASKAEFEAILGYAYPFQHMVDGPLWDDYLSGYLTADVVIVPSEESKRILKREFEAVHVYRHRDPFRVIPHGVDLPDQIDPLPKQFTVGYMGATGPDKGLRYLLEAWKRLALRDATLLFAGPYDQANLLLDLMRKFGGGNMRYMGYAPSLREFYRRVSVYVQPSVTEGFGIEILEAMAHGRPVVVSDGAGAAWHAPTRLPARDAGAIAAALQDYYQNREGLVAVADLAPEYVKDLTWPVIRERYKKAWHELLCEETA